MLIYKYVHPDRVDILEDVAIRFTQPAALNDPFETYPCLKELEESLKNRYKRYLDSMEGQADYETILAVKLSIGKKVRTMLAVLQRKISTEVAMLSLTKKRNNLLLWSHYADSHRGFVLGFDPKHPFFQGKTISLASPLMEVKYSARRQVMPSFEEIPRSKELGEIVGFTKSDNWSYEEELRMVADPSSADFVKKLEGQLDIYLYKFPSECLKEVLIGYLMRPDLREKIAQLVVSKYPHVQLYEAQLNEIEFGLNIIPYRWRS